MQRIKNIEEMLVFKRDTEEEWHCLNCGYIIEGMNVELIADTVPALREIPFVLFISSTPLLDLVTERKWRAKTQ